MRGDSGTSDARRVAWQVLTAVENGAFADAALGEQLRAARLTPRDRGLATQLVYGTIAWQGLLDRAIAQGDRDPQRLDVPIRTLLRLAFFQLIRLDRVPEFAAVSTAVELAKDVKRGAASGLVNALLRGFLRQGKRVDLPSRDAGLAAYLAAAFSHPRWLVDRWLAELGAAETEALLAANNTAAPTAVRINRRRAEPAQVIAALAQHGAAARPSAYAPDALLLDGAGDPSTLPGYREGWWALQGEASQLVAAMLGVTPGARVLDVCAAPGGKATAAAERAGDGGLVVAIDRHATGLRIARRAARRLDLTNLVAVRADGAALPLRREWTADAVLVDAPCSGLGTLRQHPEIRWRRRSADIEKLAVLQAHLLAAASVHVAPGGSLVYATCTISAAENADLVTAFLAAHPRFSVDDPRQFLAPAAHVLVDGRGFLHTFPHRHGLDGFFAARLRASQQ